MDGLVEIVRENESMLTNIADIISTFWACVKKEQNCWLWIGAGMNGGYGVLRVGKEQMLAHRLSYVIHKGGIPDEYVVHHTCHIRECVNPDHLEIISRDENTAYQNKKYVSAWEFKKKLSARDNFLRSYTVDSNTECWLWNRYVNSNGYAHIWADGRSQLVHRYSYEMHKGPVPKGLCIDHLCRNRACCNPDHLEAVTSKENSLRGTSLWAINASKVSCIRGHRFDDVNTYVNKKGNRICRKCRTDKEKLRRLAIKELREANNVGATVECA